MHRTMAFFRKFIVIGSSPRTIDAMSTIDQSLRLAPLTANGMISYEPNDTPAATGERPARRTG